MSAAAHGTLLSAAASGDDEALGTLVRTYHDRVYRFGLHVCRNGFDADDAVQEAFTKLARRPEVVRHPGALSWLMTVVRNACSRMLHPWTRKKVSLADLVVAEEEVASQQLDPQQALERWELIQSVHAGIAALPRQFREVLILRDLEGLSGDETCRLLGVDTAAMKSRLHRARAQLRDELLRRGGAASPALDRSGP